MNKIVDILNTMEYGPAPEASDHVRAWLNAHEPGFKHYIGGEFVAPAEGGFFDVTNPAGGAPLARVAQGSAADVDRAVKAARAAFKSWSALPGDERARYLYAIA